MRRYVPGGDICNAANLLDYLVGKLLKMQRHVEFQGFGGLEVDHQLEFLRLEDRQLRRLRTLENTSNLDRPLGRYISFRSISYHCSSLSGRSEIAIVVDRG